MDKKITAFTITSPNYTNTQEFRLCLSLLKKALPENLTLITTGEESPFSLRDLILRNPRGADEYVLIIKEPALLMTKGTIETMLTTLERNPGILCLLPSDVRGYRQGRTAAYHTMRELENFVSSLYETDLSVMPYDGRAPWIFLIKSETLNSLTLPENPLTLPGMLQPGMVGICLNAYIHPLIDYYEEKRDDVLPLLPQGIRSLLDIGCARGRFAEAVKAETGCRTVGIEMNSFEAQKAKQRLDLVIESDILSAALEEKFDCITCLDIIEHLGDSDAFLQKIKSLLNSGGSLVLSIPNIGHWSIIEDLIAGRWDYLPVGILTISHLRFFTKKTIEALLKNNGFEIALTQGQYAPLPDLKQKVLMFRQMNMETDEESLSCTGYYIVAKKTG